MKPLICPACRKPAFSIWQKSKLTHLGRCAHCQALLEVQTYPGLFALSFLISVALFFIAPGAFWPKYVLILVMIAKVLFPVFAIPKIAGGA